MAKEYDGQDCPSCSGSGRQTKEEVFLVNFGGEKFTETRTREIDCPSCNGVGVLGGGTR